MLGGFGGPTCLPNDRDAAKIEFVSARLVQGHGEVVGVSVHALVYGMPLRALQDDFRVPFRCFNYSNLTVWTREGSILSFLQLGKPNRCKTQSHLTLFRGDKHECTEKELSCVLTFTISQIDPYDPYPFVSSNPLSSSSSSAFAAREKGEQFGYFSGNSTQANRNRQPCQGSKPSSNKPCALTSVQMSIDVTKGQLNIDVIEHLLTYAMHQ